MDLSDSFLICIHCLMDISNTCINHDCSRYVPWTELTVLAAPVLHICSACQVYNVYSSAERSSICLRLPPLVLLQPPYTVLGADRSINIDSES